MRTTRTNDAAVVAAAQAGDRRALDELTTSYLPLVYSIVRRGLGAHPDVDDVVQDVMLRALRKLPELRTPSTFRAWLAAIAIRQVSTHRHRRDRDAERAAEIDEAAGLADTHSPSEDLTALQIDLARQRRQTERAAHWLDPDDRALLSLWWLEVAEHLARADVATAMGLSVAHTGVRIQRMRGHLEASRALVAALDQRPRCPGLAAAGETWDGRPSPLWRKRLTRHVRSCPYCTRASESLVATERLFPMYALLPVPVGLGLSLLGKLALGGGTAPAVVLSSAASTAGAGVKVGLLGQLAQAAALHPVLSTVVTGALVAGAAVTTVQLASPPPPASAPAPVPGVIAGPVRATVPPSPRSAAPSASSATPSAAPSAGASPSTSASSRATATIALGPLSLESQNITGRFIASENSFGVLIAPGTSAAITFTAVRGLADSRCVSFRYADGRFLRHASWRLRLNPDVGTALFRGDATFCPRPGAVPGSVALESSNYPGWFLRHRNNELWVDQSDGSAAFLADGSFRARPPLTR
jgi:RNA polymerase sigma factor (sigma-70 family)